MADNNNESSTEKLNESVETTEVVETTETVETVETAPVAEEPAKEEEKTETIEKPVEKKSGSNKAIIGIAAGAAGVVVIGGAVAALVITSSPKYMVSKAIENTSNDFKKIEAYQVLNNVGNGGSVEISGDLKETGIDLQANAKIYLDADSIKSGIKAEIKDDDDVVADAQVYFSHDSFVLVSESLLEESYGISFKDAKKNLPGSIFDPDEDTDFSMEEQLFENWLNVQDTIKGMEGLRKECDKLEANYREMLIKSLCNNAEVEKGKDTVKTADGKINCKTVTFKLDNESLAKSLTEVYEYAKNDKKLEDIITRYAAVESLSEDKEPDDIKDEFYDSLDDFGDSLEDLEDDDVEIEVVFYIANSRIVATDVNFEDDKDEANVKLVLGKDVSKSNEMSLTIESGKKEMSLVYTVSENTDKKYEAEIEMTVPSNSDSSIRKATASIEWDKKGGDLEINANFDGSKIVLSGSMTEEKTTHTITIDEAVFSNDNGKEKIDLGITLIFNENDKMPSAPKFKEILTMDEDDLEDITEDLEKSISKIREKYGKSASTDVVDYEA